jgi:hypothetical protein
MRPPVRVFVMARAYAALPWLKRRAVADTRVNALDLHLPETRYAAEIQTERRP